MPPFSPLSAILHGQDVSSRQMQNDTCASPAVCPLLLRLFFISAWLQSVRAVLPGMRWQTPFCQITKWRWMCQHSKKKTNCAVSSRGTFWRTQNWVVFSGIWKLWPPNPKTELTELHTLMGTITDNDIPLEPVRACVSFLPSSLSLLHFLPPTSSLKKFDRQFPRTWVVWGKEEMISWIHK